MFICQLCKKVVATTIKSQRITLETRVRVYPFRKNANRPVYRHKKDYLPDDPGGVGYETVREAIACPECAAQARSKP
jgi:hypothetical protein